MFAKVFVFIALVAAAFASPKPQAFTYAAPGVVAPLAYSAGYSPYAAPLAYASPYAAAAYPYGYSGSYYVR